MILPNYRVCQFPSSRPRAARPERRDLPSAISCLSWRKGLSAPRCALRSRRRRKLPEALVRRHSLEATQPVRRRIPDRPAPGEDRDLRTELRGVVERAGIEVDLAGHDLGPAEHPAATGRAGIARGGPAAAACQAVALGRPFQGHGPFRKADEADMTGAADALAGAAVAKALDQGLAFRPVAQRAALASTGHRHAVLPRRLHLPDRVNRPQT